LYLRRHQEYNLREMNDRISSVKVDSGEEYILCTNRNAQGKCITIKSNKSYVGSTMNDKASSVKRIR